MPGCWRLKWNDTVRYGDTQINTFPRGTPLSHISKLKFYIDYTYHRGSSSEIMEGELSEPQEREPHEMSTSP